MAEVRRSSRARKAVDRLIDQPAAVETVSASTRRKSRVTEKKAAAAAAAKAAAPGVKTAGRRRASAGGDGKRKVPRRKATTKAPRRADSAEVCGTHFCVRHLAPSKQPQRRQQVVANSGLFPAFIDQHVPTATPLQVSVAAAASNSPRSATDEAPAAAVSKRAKSAKPPKAPKPPKVPALWPRHGTCNYSHMVCLHIDITLGGADHCTKRQLMADGVSRGLIPHDIMYGVNNLLGYDGWSSFKNLVEKGFCVAWVTKEKNVALTPEGAALALRCYNDAISRGMALLA